MVAPQKRRFFGFVLGFLALIALGIFGIIGAQYYEFTQEGEVGCDNYFAVQQAESARC